MLKATIHLTELPILREAKAGELFVVQAAAENECVCARAVGLYGVSNNLMFGNAIHVVVVACRVDPGERGYHQVGEQLYFAPDTPISFVEQVEKAAFRGREADPVDLTPLSVEQQTAVILDGFDHAAVRAAGLKIGMGVMLKADAAPAFEIPLPSAQFEELRLAGLPALAVGLSFEVTKDIEREAAEIVQRFEESEIRYAALTKACAAMRQSDYPDTVRARAHEIIHRYSEQAIAYADRLLAFKAKAS